MQKSIEAGLQGKGVEDGRMVGDGVSPVGDGERMIGDGEFVFVSCLMSVVNWHEDNKVLAVRSKKKMILPDFIRTIIHRVPVETCRSPSPARQPYDPVKLTCPADYPPNVYRVNY